MTMIDETIESFLNTLEVERTAIFNCGLLLTPHDEQRTEYLHAQKRLVLGVVMASLPPNGFPWYIHITEMIETIPPLMLVDNALSMQEEERWRLRIIVSYNPPNRWPA